MTVLAEVQPVVAGMRPNFGLSSLVDTVSKVALHKIPESPVLNE